MSDLIKRENVEKVIDELEVYTAGRLNTQKVEISVLQLQRFVNALKDIPTAFDIEQFKTDLIANSEKMSEVKSITPYGKACSSNHRYYKAISTKKACYLLDKQLEENKNDRNSQKETEDLDLKSNSSSLKTEEIHLSLKRWWDGMEVSCIHGSRNHEIWLCVCKEGRFYLDGSQNYKVVEWNYPAIVPTQKQIEEAKDIIEQKKYGRNEIVNETEDLDR